MKKPKVLVLKTAGTNNDIETAEGFVAAGGEPEIVHINRFLRGEKNFSQYNILAIAGGFSYGDDISAGKVFANKLKHHLNDKLMEFVRANKLIIGICNGFQVLVKSGLFPFMDGKQTVTLKWNDSGKFECRWVYLRAGRRQKVEGRRQSLWTRNLPEIIQLPIAHAEGNFYTTEETVNKLEASGMVVFKYCDENGNDAGYPYNPNGSIRNIAAITNPEGNILGLMPHPERFVSNYQHPSWTSGCNRRIYSAEPFGLTILKNAVEYVKGNWR